MRINRWSLAVLIAFVPLSLGMEEPADASTPWFSGPAKAEVVDIQLPATLRVGVLHTRSSVAIGCTGRYSYLVLKKGKPITLTRKSVLRVKGGKQGLTIGPKTFASTIVVTSLDPGAHLTVNGKPYGGKFLLRMRSKGIIDVIEEVGLEDYLNGVLPREVGADWPIESLKAQAVISRTFVVANMGKYAARGYDVSSDVFSQVYGSLDDQSPACNLAVQATRGEILIDSRGEPVQSFFHSSCGGRTENPSFVWQDLQNPPVYLDSIRDTYCKGDPFYNWEFQIPADVLQKRLRRAGYAVGTLQKISVDKHSPSGRAWVLLVESSKKPLLISGNSFRLAVGPDEFRSTLLTSIKKRGSSFKFEGHGWGHGVGLCQWGARGRAAAGQSYQQILSTYYQNVRLVKAGPPTESPENASTQEHEEENKP